MISCYCMSAFHHLILCNSQGAKKVSLTACHSGRLYLPHTCRSRIAKHSHLYYSVQLNRPKKLTCWTGSGCSNSRKRHPLDKSLTSGQACILDSDLSSGLHYPPFKQGAGQFIFVKAGSCCIPLTSMQI